MSNDNGKTHFADDDTLAYIKKLEAKIKDLQDACHQKQEILDAAEPERLALLEINRKLKAELAEVERERDHWKYLECEAANYVESVICLRTHFTGEPPYVGWEGLGLALNETLDELAEVKSESEILATELDAMNANFQGLCKVRKELTAQLAATKKDFSEKDADFRNLCLEYEELDKELTTKLQASQAHVERLREALKYAEPWIPHLEEEYRTCQQALAATEPKEN